MPKSTRFLPLCFLMVSCGEASAQEVPGIKLPPGFRIEIYADGVPGARSLAISPKGTVFVGTRNESHVYALRDRNGDQKADETFRIRDLDTPNGVAFHEGALYVAEVSRILKYPDIERSLANPPKPQVVTAGYPSDEAHGWKFIAFSPEGKLHVPVGAPCNSCLRGDERYASITRLNPDGSGMEVFARGVRNTVGFDWHPETGELWFTDNGRDWLGDDSPPDELNRAPKAGLHFGFPFCHGRTFADPEFGNQRRCADLTPPVQELGAHVAALGMRFYRGTQFPKEYRNQVFIAEHGSWNRSEKSGYRITLVKLSGNAAASYEPFATGWLDARGEVTGRPVDVLNMPDGALLVSDDRAGKIYRISYKER